MALGRANQRRIRQSLLASASLRQPKPAPSATLAAGSFERKHMSTRSVHWLAESWRRAGVHRCSVYRRRNDSANAPVIPPTRRLIRLARPVLRRKVTVSRSLCIAMHEYRRVPSETDQTNRNIDEPDSATDRAFPKRFRHKTKRRRVRRFHPSAGTGGIGPSRRTKRARYRTSFGAFTARITRNDARETLRRFRQTRRSTSCSRLA